MELKDTARHSLLKTVVLAVTGASGATLAIEALRTLESDDRVGRVHLVASPSALRVLAEETGMSGRTDLADKLLRRASPKVVEHAHGDIGAAIASGSYPVDAMIVIPCSMGTLAGIVLCVRETPLSLIHLRNMTAVTEAGATVFPVVPAFYAKPQSIEEMARTYVQRVLAHIGLEQSDAYVWGSE